MILEDGVVKQKESGTENSIKQNDDPDVVIFLLITSCRQWKRQSLDPDSGISEILESIQEDEMKMHFLFRAHRKARKKSASDESSVRTSYFPMIKQQYRWPHALICVLIIS